MGRLQQVSQRVLQMLRGALASRKVRLALAGVCVLAAIGAGVSAFLHQRSLTANYALNQLNEAIKTGNAPALERLVDVAALASGFANNLVAALPPDAENSSPQEARAHYQHLVQAKLLAALGLGEKGEGEKGKGEGAKTPAHGGTPGAPARPLDDPVFDILREPVVLLPANLVEQLRAHPFTMQTEDGDLAIITTTVEQPRLKLHVVLRLGMRRTANGWRVTELAGGEQIAREVMDAVQQLKTKANEAFAQENERINSLMNTYYHIESCKAVVFPPSGSGEVRLRITLTGRNMSERDVVNSAAICTLTDSQNKKLAALRLENTREIKAEAAFEHAWFYTFETMYPEVKALLDADAVHCHAEAAAVSLGKGSLLYPRKLQDFPGVRLE